MSPEQVEKLWELINDYAGDWATPGATIPPSWMPSFAALEDFIDSLTERADTTAAAFEQVLESQAAALEGLAAYDRLSTHRAFGCVLHEEKK